MAPVMTVFDASSTEEVLLTAWVEDQQQEAFEYLVERYAPMVHQVCLQQWRGNTARADEAAQTVFIIFARKASQIRTASSIGAWLHRCAINTIKMQHRLDARHGQQRNQPIDAASLDTQLREENDAAELAPIMDEAIDSLSKKLRQSIILFYYHNNSIKEIADELAISENAVKRRLHESRNRLRTWFMRAGYSATLISVASTLQAMQEQAQLSVDPQLIARATPPHDALMSSSSSELVNGVLKDMTMHTIKIGIRAALLLLTCTIVFMHAADSGAEANKIIADTVERVEQKDTDADGIDGGDVAEFEEMEERDLVHPQGDWKPHGDPIGVIAAVRIDPQDRVQRLVMVTVAGDAQLQEGDRLSIARKERYIVQITAQKVFPDMVACIIDDKTWNKDKLQVELADAVYATQIKRINSDPNQLKIVHQKMLEKVTGHFQETPLADIVEFLQQQTGLKIVIDNSVADKQIPITLRVESMALKDLLQWCVRLADLKYVIQGDRILITGKSKNDKLYETVKNKRITLHRKNMSLLECAEVLKEQSGLDVHFDGAVDVNKPVPDIALDDSPLSYLVLSIAGSMDGGTYAITDKGILFTEQIGNEHRLHADAIRGFKQRLEKDANIRAQLKLETVTATFEELDVSDIVAYLQNIADIDIVLDPNLLASGKTKAVTCKVTDMSFEELFSKHLAPAMNGRWVVQDGAIYFTTRNQDADDHESKVKQEREETLRREKEALHRSNEINKKTLQR